MELDTIETGRIGIDLTGLAAPDAKLVRDLADRLRRPTAAPWPVRARDGAPITVFQGTVLTRIGREEIYGDGE